MVFCVRFWCRVNTILQLQFSATSSEWRINCYWFIYLFIYCTKANDGELNVRGVQVFHYLIKPLSKQQIHKYCHITNDFNSQTVENCSGRYCIFTSFIFTYWHKSFKEGETTITKWFVITATLFKITAFPLHQNKEALKSTIEIEIN